MTLNNLGMFSGRDPHDRATRPASMTHNAAQPTPQIELKFHHMISWDCLRDVWQGLIEHGRWDAIEAFLDAVNVPGAQAARQALETGGTLDPATDFVALERISWPAWNIVQGPGQRLDEGGSDYDQFSNGVPSILKPRLAMVDLLWIEMKAFLGNIDRSKLKQRREAARNQTGVAVTRQPDNLLVNTAAEGVARALVKVSKYKEASYTPYIHSMWEVVGYSQVDPTAPAAWVGGVQPTYQKARNNDHAGDLPLRMRCAACKKTYERPPVPPGTLIKCTICKGRTYVDFKNAA